MYEPAPPRRKKTDIVRSRNGCQSCRQKRRKCDEGKPSCERCGKLGLHCQYSGKPPLQFRDGIDRALQRVQRGQQGALAASPLGAAFPVSPTAASVSVTGSGPEDRIEQYMELQGVDPHQDRRQTDWFPPLTPFIGNGLDDVFETIPNLSSRVMGRPSPYSDAFQGIFDDDDRALDFTTHSTSQTATSVPALRGEADFLPGVDALYQTSSPPGFSANFMPYTTTTSLLSPRPPMMQLPPLFDGPGALFPQGYTKEAAVLASSSTSSHIVKRSHRIFLAHFLTSVYDLIPGRDSALRQIVIDVEAVQMAAMSLAAANLANVEGSYTYSASRSSQSWIPKRAHVEESSTFADKATFLLGAQESDDDVAPLDAQAKISIRLLLAYRELEVGTIRNLILQTVAIERALIEMSEELVADPALAWIWRTTINIRALLRATIGPFQRVDSETLHQRAIASLDRHFSADPHFIHYLNASATHISTRIILSRTLGRDCNEDPEKLARKISEWHAIMLGMGHLPDLHPPDADLDMNLTEERLFEHLELLHEQVLAFPLESLGFLPALQTFLDETTMIEKLDYASTEPLTFDDHETTMTAALYVFAHIICSPTLLHNMLDHNTLQSPNSRTHARPNERACTNLLLRIARGVASHQPTDLPRRNTYRRGITPMIFFAAIRYQDPRIFTFLDDFLADLHAQGVAWEDIQSPVSLIRLTIGIVVREMQAGRTVFKVGSTFAYTRALKEMIVEETEELLVLHGRNERGKYFNQAVPFSTGGQDGGF